MSNLMAGDDAETESRRMQDFFAFLRGRGFKGCPLCGNAEDFTWAHSAQIPNHPPVRITAHIPGATQVPGKPYAHWERFDTPLIMLICDNCTHVLTFSETLFEVSIARRNLERADHRARSLGKTEGPWKT